MLVEHPATMASSTTAFLLVLAVACLCSCSYAGSATNVSYDGRSLIINGQRRVILSGSIHYPRSTAEMWPDLIQKSKEGGLDAIETYVFWDVHEPRRREYNFEGNLDLIKFIKAVQQAGLYCILRIGPYVCAEWNFGGFPMWLYNTPGVELRTDNEIYKNEMQIFTTLIVDMVKKENLLAGQGGPIILTQIENEYGNIQGPYGARGKAYIQWCAKMAVAQNVGVPWIMCQQGDAPQPMINTCNGFYCDSFKPNNPNVPKMWTENWTGWFKAWGGRDPHRPAEDVAYAVARFFQRGGTLQNYYMYHGGTNFGRTSGGPFITTSYDYDAPLDEYGNLRQPKWGHLKQLHEAIKSMEKVLTYGDVSGQNFSDVTEATIYTYNGNSGCFLVNKDKTNDANLNFKGKNYFVPAWSVSILPDCQQEVYNTAKIRVQTSLMEKITSDEDSRSRIWQWRPENIKGPLKGRHPSLESTQLLHQFKTTGDVSDYLWYTTSFTVGHQDPGFSKHMTLRVNTTGHVLHAFVNRRLVGSQYADQGKYKFVFEKDVNVKAGKNSITLLSVTVGLQNYGSFYENMPAGIIGGPVQLIGTGNVTTKDLSPSKWLYKIGLHGEEFQLWSDQSRYAKKWLTEDLHGNRFMTWYKTSFKTPSGTEPVVVDLIGMGKGRAWVNGQSLGRYWVTKTAPWDGCEPCNYRAVYQSENCRTGCGEPTQRWYHVPRSFLNEETNTLVLFEEVSGNPATVSFATVTAGTICASVSTASGSGSGSPVMELACTGGRSISEIKFAGFGDAKGTCGSFQKGSCDASNTLSVVQQACAGKTSCSITVSDGTFGAENTCGNTVKTLTVQATCS